MPVPVPLPLPLPVPVPVRSAVRSSGLWTGTLVQQAGARWLVHGTFAPVRHAPIGPNPLPDRDAANAMPGTRGRRRAMLRAFTA